MRYENNIIEHEILTILRIGVLAGIVTLNNANACGINWQRANPIPQEIQSLQGRRTGKLLVYYLHRTLPNKTPLKMCG